MRAQFARIIDTLCAGRDREDVLADLALASAFTCLLWLTACVFMLMEPVA